MRQYLTAPTPLAASVGRLALSRDRDRISGLKTHAYATGYLV